MLRHLAIVIAACASARGQSAYDFTVAKGVMIPMRDGVRLRTDIYFPARNGVAVAGKFPVIVERTPYGSFNAEAWAAYFVPRGYIAIGQNVRGRHGSEGRWFPLRDDVQDGYDTAKWIGEQPWSNGKIGTVGTSYGGGTQHAMALSGAPCLAAMVPVNSMSNPGRYGVRHNGAFELRFFNWIFLLGPAANSARPDRTSSPPPILARATPSPRCATR